MKTKRYRCKYGWQCTCGTSERVPNRRPTDPKPKGDKYCHHIDVKDIFVLDASVERGLSCGWALDVEFENMREVDPWEEV